MVLLFFIAHMTRRGPVRMHPLICWEYFLSSFLFRMIILRFCIVILLNCSDSSVSILILVIPVVVVDDGRSTISQGIVRRIKLIFSLFQNCIALSLICLFSVSAKSMNMSACICWRMLSPRFCNFKGTCTLWKGNKYPSLKDNENNCGLDKTILNAANFEEELLITIKSSLKSE